MTWNFWRSKSCAFALFAGSAFALSLSIAPAEAQKAEPCIAGSWELTGPLAHTGLAGKEPAFLASLGTGIMLDTRDNEFTPHQGVFYQVGVLGTKGSAERVAYGEASAAVKQAVLNGAVLTSAVGTTVSYSTLDNPRDPHDGLRAEVRQDVAGLGGGVDFLRSTGDVRYYKSFGDGAVAMTRVQSGTIAPYGGQTLPLTSSFFGGPALVRGFAPNGFGPRDLTAGTSMDNIGGSSYWATTAQLTAPIPGLPPEVALKGAFFADAASLWGYRGATSFPALSQSLNVADSRKIRASVGASLIWDSPLGALHVDYALPVSKTNYDITQRLSFGAGPF